MKKSTDKVAIKDLFQSMRLKQVTLETENKGRVIPNEAITAAHATS